MKLVEAQGTFKATWKSPTYPDGDIVVPSTIVDLKHYLPREIKGSFCGGASMISLKGCPLVVNGDFNLMACVKLESLRELRELTNLKVRGVFFFNAEFTRHILNVFFVPGIKHVSSGFTGTTPGLGSMISHFLGGDRDIHACQQLLIDKGYGQYATI